MYCGVQLFAPFTRDPDQNNNNNNNKRPLTPKSMPPAGDEHAKLKVIIIIIIEGLSLLQSIPPTTADKQTQAQKRRGSRSRKLLGGKLKVV